MLPVMPKLNLQKSPSLNLFGKQCALFRPGIKFTNYPEIVYTVGTVTVQ